MRKSEEDPEFPFEGLARRLRSERDPLPRVACLVQRERCHHLDSADKRRDSPDPLAST